MTLESTKTETNFTTTSFSSITAEQNSNNHSTDSNVDQWSSRFVEKKLNNTIASSVPLTSTSTSSSKHDRQPSVQLKIEASGGPPNHHKPFSTIVKVNFIQRLKRNVDYFFSQFFVLLSQLSPIVQSLSALIILLYLIQFGGDITIDFFALTPGEVISPGQWYHTIIAIWSHPFLETNIWMLIIDLVILSTGIGTLIEPLWGHKEVIRFIFITCLTASILTSIHYVMLYSVTTLDQYLFEVRIHGLMAFCAAVAVSVKQLLPQSVLIATAFGRLKNDDIPFTIFVLSFILSFFHLVRGVQVVLFAYGVLVSWFYLRFLQPHTRHSAFDSNTTIMSRGDLSNDSFAFESFFPALIRPLISVISNSIYKFFVCLNVCPKIPSPAVQLFNENSASPSYHFTSSAIFSNQPSSAFFKYHPLLSLDDHLNHVQCELNNANDYHSNHQPLMSTSLEANNIENL